MAKLGTRFPVKIPCKNKDVGNQYALVTKSVIEFFGMEIASNPVVGDRKASKKAAGAKPKPAGTGNNNKDPKKRPAKGSSKGRSIKIPVDADGTKFKSMPVPPGATIEDLRTFCNGLKKSKPAFFISPEGVRVFLNKPSGTGKP